GQRAPKGDDLRQAKQLENRVEELRRASAYAEAREPARELLALRRRLHGEGHWETADARRLLATLERAAALPAEARAELADVDRQDATVLRLHREQRWAEALPLLERALDVRRRHLGADDPDAVKAVHDLAFFRKQAGRYAEAEPLYREAVVR